MFKRERLDQDLARSVTLLDPARSAMGLHATGGVHHVAPKVIEKFALANDPCDRCTRADTYSDVQRVLTARVEVLNGDPHVQRHVSSAIDMVRYHHWQTRSRHITVANRFDLFEAAMLRNVVKTRENIIQHADHDLGANNL